MLPPPPRSPLFPYTTLFRSTGRGCSGGKPVLRRPSCNPPYSMRCGGDIIAWNTEGRSEEHTSELQSRGQLVCRLLLEKKKKKKNKDDVETKQQLTRYTIPKT